ncbi:sugar-transfer associated ATP-grasp domain-containing protein [Halomonas ventosae]|uniref:Putative polysaccharide biosynthesis protein n=1 Tax=Halomonas ventosae TaxID=229007 RepID=A0A2T0VKZ3_9GAMM|nr:sugar-transfer associated ATP-grasp domain-containing protein [Halomonas ventosae]PRY70911.1 putative polysaccharide biosynthesis protein [Halomonas ventosae]
MLLSLYRRLAEKWRMGLLPSLTPSGCHDYIRMYRLRVDECKQVTVQGKRYDATLLFRNKLYVNSLLSYAGLPVCEDLGTIEAGEVRTLDGKPTDLHLLFRSRGGGVFVKPVMGSGGRGCALLRSADDPRVAEYLASSGSYLVQRPLEQEEVMSALYPASINTVRIVTVSRGQAGPVPYCAVLRVGCGGSSTDNWTSGGLVANLDVQGGRVVSPAFRKRPFQFLERHPDSGQRIEGFEVPRFNEMVDVATRAHRLFPFASSLGWDLACVRTGVVIIEVNNDWGANVHRIFDKSFDRHFLTAVESS